MVNDEIMNFSLLKKKEEKKKKKKKKEREKSVLVFCPFSNFLAKSCAKRHGQSCMLQSIPSYFISNVKAKTEGRLIRRQLFDDEKSAHLNLFLQCFFTSNE